MSNRLHKRPSPTPGPARPGGAATPRLQDTVRLSADGLAKVLGDLEARVLQTVWDLAVPVPARTVYERVIAAHRVAPLTVVTVLNKLVDKGILRREKQGDLLHYSARLTEAEFIAHTSRRVVEGILSLRPDAVAASMVDVLAEREPAQLAALAHLIHRKLRDQGGAPVGELAREANRGSPDDTAPNAGAAERAAPDGAAYARAAFPAS